VGVYRTAIEQLFLTEMVEEDRATIYIEDMDAANDIMAPDPVKGIFDDDSILYVSDDDPNDIFGTYFDDFEL
jgi:hypothetical protein